MALPVASSSSTPLLAENVRVPILRNNKAYHHLVSGGLSGLASAVCLQPLDLLKTRLQQGVDVKGKGREIIPAFRQVVRDDGVFGLWRGTVPTLARNVPGVAVYFYLLSEIRHAMSQTGMFASNHQSLVGRATGTDGPRKSSALPQLTTSGNLMAGAVARTSVGFVLSPFTVMKSRYESNLYPQYKTLLSGFRHVLATQGVRGVYQGFTATAIRDAPYAGIYIGFYEEGKRLGDLLIRPEWGVPYAAIHTVCGMSSAALATLATSPADCVKTRMQVRPKEHPTLRSAIIRMYRERGIVGFFSGSTLRISRKAASSAIAWTVYEGLLIVLRDRENLLKRRL